MDLRRRPSRILRPVPTEFGTATVLSFDRSRHDFGAAFAADLGCCGPQEMLGEAAVPAAGRPQRVREQFTATCASYERLVREVVAPHLRLVGSAAADAHVLYQYPPTIRVQRWCGRTEGAEGPDRDGASDLQTDLATAADIAADDLTIPATAVGAAAKVATNNKLGRESVPPARYKLGPVHCDGEYGHQPGEINFWMPITPLSAATTLWCESAAGVADFAPLLPACGEVVRFHGALCRHFAATSTVPTPMPQRGARPVTAGTWQGGSGSGGGGSCVAGDGCSGGCGDGPLPSRFVPGVGYPDGTARVSIDFRCALADCFDAEWRLPGMVFRHEMRSSAHWTTLEAAGIVEVAPAEGQPTPTA
jgi:hypothetical protein